LASIERIGLHRRTVPLRRPFVTAVRTAHSIDVLIAEVVDTEGRTGWGEAPTSWRVTGESTQSVTAAIQGPLAEALKGQSTVDPTSLSERLERAVVRNSSARMALDCALYDLAAQTAGLALHHYLGGSVNAVRTDMTLSAVIEASDIDILVRTATECVGAGFRTLKVKVGAGGDDLTALIELRRAVGCEVRLRIDANQGWSATQAVSIITALEDAHADLELVEQPVARDDLEGMAFVTERASTTIMADEAVWTRRDLREVIRLRAADAVNIKLAKCGGLREGLALVSLAKESGLHVVVGCMAESHVGISAAAALASVVDTACERETVTHDLDGGLLLTRSPVDGGVTYDGDRLLLSQSPGSGISGLTSS
jgi:L-alanine-DL-glutamate epimerase-like enolase superfamily enzyme